MNPFVFDEYRIKLSEQLLKAAGKTKLWLLVDYYIELLKCNDENIFASYSEEFIDNLVKELENFNSFFTSSKNTETIQILLRELLRRKSLENKKEKLRECLEKTCNCLLVLENILDGKNHSPGKSHSFPLLFIGQKDERNKGVVESIKVKISKSKKNNSFTIIPTLTKVDEALEKQVEVSFRFAINYVNAFGNKVKNFHEVIIVFENKSISYEGCSLGIILTIAFIEELTKLYNLPYSIKVNSNIASTAGVNADGKIKPISSAIIKEKVEVVFYSPIEILVVAKDDELAAVQKLSELKSVYPKRQLSIVAIENIYELIDRRSLIEIKRLSPIVRTIKLIKKSPVAALMVLVVVLLLTFFYLKEKDTNPYSVDFEGHSIQVKNKFDKILWELPSLFDEETNRLANVSSGICKIIDVNNDEINEVIVSNEAKDVSKNEFGRIVCYDKEKKIVWKFNFHKELTTRLKTFSPDFTLQLADTITRNGTKELYLNTSHSSSEYPSAICRIDVKTGKEISGALFNAGRFNQSVFYNDEATNKKYLMAGLFNNGFNKVGIVKIDLEKLSGQTVSDVEHTFTNLGKANFEKYILFPNTDYNQYIKEEHSHENAKTVQFDPARKRIMVTLIEGKVNSGESISYEFDLNLDIKDIVTSTRFEKARDALVASGKISLPKTYTKEFQHKIKRNLQRLY